MHECKNSLFHGVFIVVSLCCHLLPSYRHSLLQVTSGYRARLSHSDEAGRTCRVALLSSSRWALVYDILPARRDTQNPASA